MVMMIRVIVQDSDIRKIVLPEKPVDTDTLIKLLEERLELKYKFTLQYEDPDFNNALCNLTDISDLPERATLKIFPVLMSPVPIPSSSQGESVHSDQLSDQSTSTERKKEWPENFEIPRFSVNVEHRLRQGNAAFLKDGKRLDVGRDLKHDILEGLAGTMYTYKEYPSEDNFSQVAEALIKTHPCLTEPGSSTGWIGWKNSLKFKMGNYRTKMRKHGCSDMALKRGGESSGKSVYNRGIKKPKRCELNFLPNFPEGENEDSLESKRVEAVEEMKKKFPNLTMIEQRMSYTFAMRRKELVHSEPPVSEILERWPGLFTENQIFAEFSRISAKNLKQEFYTALDLHTARFLEIFQSKGGARGKILQEFVGQTGSKTSDVTVLRTVVLRGLPVLLGDNPDQFFRTCFVDDVDADISQFAVAVLSVIPEDEPSLTPNSLHLEGEKAIILEGRVVVDGLPDLPKAVCLLFGLIYALNLDYPKVMQNTFEFIQRVFVSLGGKSLKPKLQTLKNLLLT